MLKWTKQKRKLSRAGKHDSNTIDNTSDAACKESITGVLHDNTESGNQVLKHNKGYTSFLKFKSTGEDHTKEKASKSQPPSQQLNENEGLLVTDRLTSPTSLTSTASSALSASPALLKDNSKAYDLTAGPASQPQIAISLDGNPSTPVSSFKPDTPPSLTPQHPASKHPDSSTSFMASNGNSAENPPTDYAAQSRDSLSSQQKLPRSISPILPDVTRSVPTMNNDILGPEVVWEQENLTMSQVADLDTFPCVCFFEESVKERNGQREFLSPGLKIYSRQPVLLHMKTKKKQARARTIYKDPHGAYYEVGQTLIIPDDYKGRLSMLYW